MRNVAGGIYDRQVYTIAFMRELRSGARVPEQMCIERSYMACR